MQLHNQADPTSLEQQGTEMLVEMRNYLKRVVPAVSALTDAIYQGTSENMWNSFGQFIDGIEWVISATSSLKASRVRPDDVARIDLIVATIPPFLQQMNQSLETKDTVQLADLIHYELSPVLDIFLAELTTIVGSGE